VHCGEPWQQPRALPAGFAASGAVLCAPSVNLVNGSGRAGFTERVADRGLATLVAVLQRPSAQLAPGLICAAQLVAVPVLFLIGRDGQIVRPVIPTDECGQPQPEVLDALQHVPWLTL
jgi:hypothetical protein